MNDRNSDTRERLYEHLDKLLERVLKDRPEKRKFNFDSPFIVTVVGGILLGVFSTMLQSRIAASQQAEAIRSETIQRTEKLAYDFADEFPMSLSLAYRFKLRLLWLGATPYNSAARFTDGRNFADTRSMYENLFDRYMAQKPVGSLCNQIIESFPSTNIDSLAVTLDANMESLIDATNESQVDTAFDLANANYRELTKEIFSEISNPRTYEKQ